MTPCNRDLVTMPSVWSNGSNSTIQGLKSEPGEPGKVNCQIMFGTLMPIWSVAVLPVLSTGNIGLNAWDVLSGELIVRIGDYWGSVSATR